MAPFLALFFYHALGRKPSYPVDFRHFFALFALGAL